MASPFHALTPAALAATALLAALPPAGAQTAASAGTVTVTGIADPGAAVAGFGDAPLANTPVQARNFGSELLQDRGVTSIGGLTQLDASLGDAYDAEGYWSIISARGYTLDNRYNYQRDGLPINAETAIPLDNKSRVELLDGTSGIQAGTSAPGGIVDLIVKRPVANLRRARVEFSGSGSLLGAVDLSQRFGPGGAFGLRLNAAAERLDPVYRDTQGHRSLLALAADWQINPDSLIEAEIESSRQTQPSVTGFSMLGDTVPDARSIDPRLNLNHQPWGQPVVFDGDTASLRWRQRLAGDWRFTAHAMTQRLRTDDRTAFPYGVYNADYTCPQWCDRFAPDGSFTYWQYVSDNERRRSDALDLSVSGKLRTGGVEHALQVGVLGTRFTGRFQDQIFDIAGTGNIDGSLQTPPSPGTPAPNTNRDERSTEAYLRDAMHFGDAWSLWAGLRHSRLHRATFLTSPGSDGTLEPTRDDRGVTIPWLALARQLTPQTLAYASWGQGLETDVAPNQPLYANAGQPLPALKSRQAEIGLKHSGERFDATLALFDIDRPQAASLGGCDAAATCTYQIDGGERHRGVQTNLTLRDGAWTWQGSAMWLDAERHGSSQPGVDGTRPVNVPRTSLRAGVEYLVPALPGLALQASLMAEGNRVVLPYDQSVRIPGWSRVDLGARWTQRTAGATLTWRLGVDNTADRRAWRESPYEFSHVYLYPVTPRTWRASLSTSF